MINSMYNKCVLRMKELYSLCSNVHNIDQEIKKLEPKVNTEMIPPD